MLKSLQSWITRRHLDPKGQSPDWQWWIESKILKVTYWPRWFHVRFIAKCHIVKTDLRAGVWHDKDEVLFRACFAVLTKFVLEETNYPFISGNKSPLNDELKDIYFWYIFDFPKLENDPTLDDQKLEAIKTLRLHQLVALRDKLWS